MKIGLISLGCPKNLVDGEVMLGLAHQAGHELTPEAADADVVVVNTCAFIDRAKQESIDAILEIAELKKASPSKRLVVTGCLAERYRDELKDQIPEIDAVLGTGEVPRIVAALQPPASSSRADPLRHEDPSWGATRQAVETPVLGPGVSPVVFHRPHRRIGHQPLGGRTELPTYIYDADTPRIRATPRHYSYVKIAEGCDYKCAFCIIPRLRGHYRSRPTASIVAEARALAEAGVRELILISQDTTFYGIDRGERGALARLLRELNTVDGLEWIRLLYLYPTTIDDAMLDAMADCNKVVKYIDLPLQHASDRVLKRMRRPGTRTAYERLLGRVRDRIPGVTLRTTFIVGFPGEAEEDVDELSAFLDAVRFDHVGIFAYSHEEGTAAGEWNDNVPGPVKRARLDRLMCQQKRIVTAAHKARVGQRVRLVVDGPSDEHHLVLRGRLPGQAPEVDPQVFLTECDPTEVSPGDFVCAEVVGARGYDLVARPLGNRPSGV
jgi:ribosomal protein S12 methylthiotransferase